MVQVTPFLLVLSLALVAPGFSAKECMLTGNWADHLGSTLSIDYVDQEGKFSGTYCPSHRDSQDTNHCVTLIGIQQCLKTDIKTTFGFIINCFTARDIVVFTGHCSLENNKETLETIELKLSSVDNLEPTMVSTRTFTRLGDIAPVCKAHRSTCDADRTCCRSTCL